jgi:hypothetical protein
MVYHERLVVEHLGSRVVLTLSLANEYAAIEVYEKVIAQAREGFVLLDVDTVPAVEVGNGG